MPSTAIMIAARFMLSPQPQTLTDFKFTREARNRSILSQPYRTSAGFTES
jgi:hypothetical protein